MKKALIFLLATLIGAMPLNAYAIKDGIDYPHHPRVVPIYFKLPKWSGAAQSCTGFLFSPRIVLTAAHCVHDPMQMEKKVPLKANQMWVGAPGSLTKPNNSLFAVARIFYQQGYKPYRGYSYTDDFAVIVLKAPLARVARAELATKEQIEELVRTAAIVSTGGYGGTSAADAETQRQIYPQMASFKMISFEAGIRSVRERMAMWGRDYYQSDGVFFMRYEPGTAHPCNGDSGSGYFLEKNGRFTYLGITWPGVHPLCEAGDFSTEPRFIPNSGQVIAFRGVFMDLEIIRQGEEYVTAFPSNTFLGCKELNLVYPNGITSAGSPNNRGAGPIRKPKYSPPIYRLNKQLDKDKDGIVCEVLGR